MLVGLVLACSSSAAGSTTHSVASPSPDQAGQNYVAIVHDFWLREQEADVVSGRFNLAAKVCLGVDPPGTPTRLELVDPPACRERAVALLANHEEFLADLAGAQPPPKMVSDDQTFRTQLPRTIADLKALITATGTRSKQAVLQAANAYNDDMYPTVTDALNDVDPSVSHP